AYLGYSCQGNEFSHYMLLSAFYMLNRTSSVNQHTIHPYIHSFSNMQSNDVMLRGFQIPDVLPSSLHDDVAEGDEPPAFSLVAGDFEEIYGKLKEGDEREPQQGQWDAVLTCFFIDTARNIVNYLEIIHGLLAPGGVWINLGPLLWHFENSSTPSDTSIELSLDEVVTLAEKVGFDVSERRMVDATYVDMIGGGGKDGKEGSMLSHVYRAAYWTATKK
ncbi:N2227-like protein, partial [Clavulina sp. PMI_390]